MRGTIKTLAFLVGGLAAGFALAVWTSDGDAGWADADRDPLDARVAALERRLAREADARAALEAEISGLHAALETLAFEPPEGRAERSVVDEGADATAPGGDDGPLARLREIAERARSRRPATPEETERRRLERFVEVGFTRDRAEWIERRVGELRLEALEAQHEAERTGESFPGASVRRADERLRDEIGDADYERYLTALGRPTSVTVRNVLPGSAAELAGLRPGDSVISYGGRRVFDMRELNRLTLEGHPGEAVAVEVLRDGQPMQVYVQRGPVGIFGRGR